MKKSLGWTHRYGKKPEKIFRIMKLLLVFMTVTSLTISAATYSQVKVTLNLKEVGVMELFKEIQKKTDFYFVYNVSDLQQYKNLSVSVRNESVESVLKRVFGEDKLEFVTEGNVIVVKPRALTAVPQQTMVIRGKVKDADGEKLPGVTILLKGTTIGVSSDVNGNFEMTLPRREKIMLEFSFIGMKKQVVEYKGQEELIVVMKSEELSLDEVVVTGYQVIDKREQTSAITSVKAADILVPGMTSLDQALEGRIPELMLMSNSGEIGATPRIRIRGTSTLLGNREPLWVLDGVIMTDPVKVDPTELNDPDYLNIVGNAIAGINPQDIERIDVLKDASATALYGTRAANGVIVVTTKKGAIGKARFSYNHTSKFTRRPRYTDRNINLMNSQERVQFGKDLADMHYVFPSGMLMVGYEGALHRYHSGQTDYEGFLQEVKWYETVNTDWFDLLTRDTYSHGHNLSISGGSEDVRYYASIGYDDEDGVSKTTYLKRYTMRVNLDADITKKLKAFLKLSGNVQKKNNLMDGLDAMDYAYNTTRALPAFNENGSLFYFENRAYPSGYGTKMFRYNILNEIANSSNEYNGNTVAANLELKYKVFTCWEVDVMGSYSRSNTLQEKWWGEKSHYVALMKNGEYEDAPIGGDDGQCQLPYGGILKTASTTNESYTLRFQSDFRKVFGREQQHLITNTLGFEANGNTVHVLNDEDRLYVKERGMKFVGDIDLDKFPHYKNWLKSPHRNIQHGITNMLAGYMTFAYGYKRHFILNANFRFDASNKFGDRSNEKLLPVWSVSGMWNAKENLLKNVNFISDMQFRASYGKQGNMLETMSPNLIIQQGVIDPYYEENVSTVYTFPNPNLMWEETWPVNLSLDISMLDSRLTLSGTYYYKKTLNCFTSVNVSSVNGISTYVMNGGDLENKGYTVQAMGVPVKLKNFRWNVSAYASVNLNTVQTNTAQNYTLNDYLNGTALIDGEAVSSFYSYRFQGLNPINGTPVFDDYSDRRHLLKDKNLEELVLMTMENSGTREPKMSGGLQTSLSWKGLSLSANFTYSLGSKVRLFPLYSPIYGGVKAQTNVRKEFTNRWQNPGDERYTDVPVILSTSDPLYSSTQYHFSNSANASNDPEITKITKFADNIWDMYDKSDFRVVSGNYLKCSSMVLRYIVDAKYLKKTPFSALSVSLSGTNLFTWSARKLKGQDPSQAGFAKPNLSLRPTYTLGVNVSF